MNQVSDLKVEDHGNFILSYSTDNRISASMDFLCLESEKQFLSVINDMREKLQLLKIPGLKVTVRVSDPVNIDMRIFSALGLEYIVSLSHCGKTMNSISVHEDTTTLSDSYRIRSLSINEVLTTTSVLQLVCDNFHHSIASTESKVKARLQLSHQRGEQNSDRQHYFVAEYLSNDEWYIVGLAKSQQSTIGISKNLLYLALAVVQEDHRGRGLYRNLLHARIQQGLSDNARFVYCQADLTTSAAILHHMGLEEFERSHLYHLRL